MNPMELTEGRVSMRQGTVPVRTSLTTKGRYNVLGESLRRQHRLPELGPCFNQPRLGTGHRDAQTRDASSFTVTPPTGRRNPVRWTGCLVTGVTPNEERKTHTITDQRDRRECCPAEIEAQRTSFDKSKNQWLRIGIRITNTFSSAPSAMAYTKHRIRMMSIAFTVRATSGRRVTRQRESQSRAAEVRRP
jgi:hypothetical protein